MRLTIKEGEAGRLHTGFIGHLRMTQEQNFHQLVKRATFVTKYLKPSLAWEVPTPPPLPVRKISAVGARGTIKVERRLKMVLTFGQGEKRGQSGCCQDR